MLGFKDFKVMLLGFSYSRCDFSLFIYRHGADTTYLLIFVDDFILTASFTTLLQRFIASLHKKFDMTNFGSLNYFLSISISHDSTWMPMSRQKYALELLDRAHMPNCNHSRAPIDTKSKLVQMGIWFGSYTLS